MNVLSNTLFDGSERSQWFFWLVSGTDREAQYAGSGKTAQLGCNHHGDIGCIKR